MQHTRRRLNYLLHLLPGQRKTVSLFASRTIHKSRRQLIPLALRSVIQLPLSISELLSWPIMSLSSHDTSAEHLCVAWAANLINEFNQGVCTACFPTYTASVGLYEGRLASIP